MRHINSYHGYYSALEIDEPDTLSTGSSSVDDESTSGDLEIDWSRIDSVTGICAPSPAKMESQLCPPSGLVDTVATLAQALDTMVNLPITPPSLYLDLEGINLSRQGSISILQIHVAPKNVTYLIDVHAMGAQSFTTLGSRGRNLKAILEDPAIPKVFFDLRNDSDALHAHFDIFLAGIQDLQLMELATRCWPLKLVSGLAKCITRDLLLSWNERQACIETKQQGIALFAPEHGGSYEVFNMRPLPEELVIYCMQDVQYLPQLWKVYNFRMGDKWAIKVQQASNRRTHQRITI